VRTLVALGACAALATGCGGPGEAEVFRSERLRPLEQRVERDRAAVARIVEAAQLGNRTDAEQIRAAVERLGRTGEAARGLQPPAAAVRPLARYAAAIDRLATELRAYAAALAAGHRGSARAAASRARSAVDELVRSRAQLDAAVTADG
jgi:hypothetical protein